MDVCRRGWIAFIVVLAACGGDGAAVDADVPAAGVACGLVTCTTPDQACCFVADPDPHYCYTIAGGACTGGHPLYCDGNEDCGGGTVCCYTGDVSACTDTAECVPPSGRVMCHGSDTSSCQSGESCCPLPLTDGAYGVCAADC